MPGRLNLKAENFQFASFRRRGSGWRRTTSPTPRPRRWRSFSSGWHVVETGLQMFDSLLAAFLGQRLTASWTAEEAAIRTWLEPEPA